MQWAKQKNGFTIVELLIVVVVIAILATITIVAFNGIQSRANDTAVQADLRNMAMKIREYHVVNNAYPAGGGATGSFTNFDALSVNKATYLPSTNNIYYCLATIDGIEQFALAARTKSGSRWAYTNTGQIIEHTGSWAGSGDPCTGAGIPVGSTNFTYKYGVSSANVWSAWIR